MQRRTLLKLGVASGALLAVAGAGLALLKPGLERGQLSAPAKALMAALAGAVLEDALPLEAQARQLALQAHLERVDETIAGLPPPLQNELGELLTVLISTPGRRLLAGLSTDWPEAGTSDVHAALQDMRLSAVAVRQQAYHAMRDLTHAAYFAHPDTWAYLGYTGQIPVSAAANLAAKQAGT